jgi:hypothetical protein
MNPSQQQLSLMFFGAIFFAVVAPWIAVIVPVLPILFLALLGMDNPLVPFVLPFVFGSVPAFVAGLLFVIIATQRLGSRELSSRQLSALGRKLCLLSFIIWFMVGAALFRRIESLEQVVVLLVVATLFGGFAAIGGHLTPRFFLRFVSWQGSWSKTRIGTVAGVLAK